MISEIVACREAALTGRLNYLAIGTGTAHINIYGNTRPANASVAAGASPLVSVPLNNAIGTVASGALTLSIADTGLIASTGVAAWARVTNRNGDTVFDMDAGLSGSGAECVLADVNLFAGGSVAVLSAVLG